ncbi:hypothetical protein [Maritimibacter sp. 55A14]|uniref:hypothetical protein n=1 Tax=Maritimibacter sp. 55A14 TaxID=2174844 RepID=UPI001E43C9A3|nr:hypothetical protein [Maritimibacter sp. 55A14]
MDLPSAVCARASVAGALADGQSGTARAAALAVRGTAEHQLARQAMAQGDYSASTLDILRRADTAMREMLALDPDLDPLGAMSDRRREIADEMVLVHRRAG